MSDETKKPFAEARSGRLVVGDVTVNYDFGESARIGRERFEGLAGIVNAAVEQREAKLRGLLLKTSEALCRADFDGVGQCIGCDIRFDQTTRNAEAYQQHVEECPQGLALHNIAEFMERYSGPDYVAGDVACGIAMDLGIAMGTVEDLALIIETYDSARGVLAPFLRAKGLAEKVPLLDDVSDEDLAAEVKRRDELEKIEHIFTEHEYGWRDGRTTITGRSYCGKALDYGGRWTARTREDFVRDGANGRTCVDCGVRFAEHDPAQQVA